MDGARRLLTELDTKQQASLEKKLALTEEFAEIERGLAEELQLAGVEKADPAENSQALLEKSLTEVLSRLYELWVEEYQEIEAMQAVLKEAFIGS